MSRTWRWLSALLAAAGVALTAGVATAQAAESESNAESDTAKCSAGGYHAEATVKYRRDDTGILISAVSVNTDEQAGPKNRVRLSVKDDARSVFSYTSGPNVTAGPYLFDYSDHPIKVTPASSDDVIKTEVTFTFDTSGDTGGDTSGSSGGSGQDDSSQADTTKAQPRHGRDNPASYQPAKRPQSSESDTSCTASITL